MAEYVKQGSIDDENFKYLADVNGENSAAEVKEMDALCTEISAQIKAAAESVSSGNQENTQQIANSLSAINSGITALNTTLGNINTTLNSINNTLKDN